MRDRDAIGTRQSRDKHAEFRRKVCRGDRARAGRVPGAHQPRSGRQRYRVQRVRLFLTCRYTSYTGTNDFEAAALSRSSALARAKATTVARTSFFPVG